MKKEQQDAKNKQGQKMLNFIKFTFLLSLMLAFSGCNFRPKTPDIPTSVELNSTVADYDIKDAWWQDFDNSELNELIDSALKNNSDLLLAYNTLEQARVQLNLAKIDFMPNIGLQGDVARTKTSSMLQTAAPSMKYNLASAAMSASWEIDLWGRIRNSLRAAQASFEASEYDLANARLSIAANVANTYFTLLSLMDQEIVLKESLASYEATLQIRKDELESGYITEVVYYQAKASVDSAKSQLAMLQDSLISTRTALAILVGKDPAFIAKGELKLTNPDFKIPQVPDAISADILERRADIASALKRFKAANAQIGVARANYFPRLDLTGLLGFTSTDLKDLINSNARTWQVGGSLVMPLFDFGRTANQVKLAWLDQNASMLNYDKTLKNALGEVRDALDLRQNATIKLESAQNLVASNERVFDLSKLRYDNGYSSHLEYLDAQRMLLSARLELAKAKAGIATSVVEVYKALGGGFVATPLKEELDSK